MVDFDKDASVGNSTSGAKASTSFLRRAISQQGRRVSGRPSLPKRRGYHDWWLVLANYRSTAVAGKELRLQRQIWILAFVSRRNERVVPPFGHRGVESRESSRYFRLCKYYIPGLLLYTSSITIHPLLPMTTGSQMLCSPYTVQGGGPSVPYVPSNAAQCHPHNLENAETPWACVCVCVYVWDSSTSSWDWISCRRRHENPLLPDSFPHNHDESSVPIAVLVTDYPRFLTLSAASPTLDPGHLGVASRRCLLV
jgi:hypothetical protein